MKQWSPVYLEFWHQSSIRCDANTNDSPVSGISSVQSDQWRPHIDVRLKMRTVSHLFVQLDWKAIHPVQKLSFTLQRSKKLLGRRWRRVGGLEYPGFWVACFCVSPRTYHILISERKQDSVLDSCSPLVQVQPRQSDVPEKQRDWQHLISGVLKKLSFVFQ